MNNRIKIKASAFVNYGSRVPNTVYSEAVITVSDETLGFIRSLVIEILDSLDEPLTEGEGLCLIDRDELNGMSDSDILGNLIPVIKGQAPELFEEGEDMIEYHYTIDVADLLKDNFQDILN